MPFCNGDLASDQSGGVSETIIQDFQKILCILMVIVSASSHPGSANSFEPQIATTETMNHLPWFE